MDRSGTQSLGREPLDARGVIPAWNEADLLAVGLVGDAQAVPAGDLPDLRFRVGADRKAQVRQLLLGEAREDIRLVLVPVDRAQEPVPAVRGPVHAGVMPRGQELHADPADPAQEEIELDRLVAGDAGVRGAPAGVLPGEAAGDAPPAPRPEAEHVMPDP